MAFKLLGDEIKIFLDYSDFGAAFVFGNNFREHFFAFKVSPQLFALRPDVVIWLDKEQTVITQNCQTRNLESTKNL
mgnify:FL=1